MPSPLATSLLAFGAILTAATVVGGVIVAGVGLSLEVFVFLSDGLR